MILSLFFSELFGIEEGGKEKEKNDDKESMIFIKFRIVEEGPKAVITIPYDSRSASPVYEILPEKQRRSIIAYCRLPLNFNNMEEYFRRIELFEVSSDEKCGELAIGIHIKELSGTLQSTDAAVALHQPIGKKPDFLGISRIDSTSTVSSPKPNNESNAILNELEAKGIEITSAESIGRISSPKNSIKSSNSASFRSLKEETDVQDEEELNAEMVESMRISESTSNSNIQNYNSDTKSEYGEILGLLNLEIVAAQRLPKEKRLLRSSGYAVNPFVTISFGKKSFKTKVKRNTAIPIG